MNIRSVFTVLFLSFFATSAYGQTPPPACAIQILSPADGAHVGDAVDVEGEAAIPTGTRLWLLAHRTDVGSLWWPQGGGAVSIKNGRWQLLVVLGIDRDIGHEFQITARVFSSDENEQLERWVATSAEHQYPGIRMPLTVDDCPSGYVTVNRVR